MSNNTISVIVPVYKVESYLDRCVQSIVNQSYSQLEIILVDDGSKDQSGLLCDQWKEKDDSWLNYLLNVHIKNRIPSETANTIANESTHRTAALKKSTGTSPTIFPLCPLIAKR